MLTHVYASDESWSCNHRSTNFQNLINRTGVFNYPRKWYVFLPCFLAYSLMTMIFANHSVSFPTEDVDIFYFAGPGMCRALRRPAILIEELAVEFTCTRCPWLEICLLSPQQLETHLFEKYVHCPGKLFIAEDHTRLWIDTESRI